MRTRSGVPIGLDLRPVRSKRTCGEARRLRERNPRKHQQWLNAVAAKCLAAVPVGCPACDSTEWANWKLQCTCSSASSETEVSESDDEDSFVDFVDGRFVDRN